MSQKVDQIVFDCYVKSADIILQGRNANIRPIQNPLYPVEPNISIADFCSSAIAPWRKNLSHPLHFDIFAFDSHSHPVLIERWKFSFQKREDNKEIKVGSVNRRVVTFLRTLYSFVRLIPGFQILRLRKKSDLSFAIYNPSENAPPDFAADTLTYDFSPVNATKGILSVCLTYMSGSILQVWFLSCLCCEPFIDFPVA